MQQTVGILSLAILLCMAVIQAWTAADVADIRTFCTDEAAL